MCVFTAAARGETPVLSCQEKRVHTGPKAAAHISFLLFQPVAFFHALVCLRNREVNPKALQQPAHAEVMLMSTKKSVLERGNKVMSKFILGFSATLLLVVL